MSNIPKPWAPPTSPVRHDPISTGISLIALFESVSGIAVGFESALTVGTIANAVVGVALSRGISFEGRAAACLS